MEKYEARIYRTSAMPLLTGILIYGIVLILCLILLPSRGWLAALILTICNVPFLGAEWLRISQTWLLIDWNGVTLSTLNDIHFVSWKEANGIVRNEPTDNDSPQEFRLLRGGVVGLTFDDSIDGSDGAADLIDERIARAQQRAAENEEGDQLSADPLPKDFSALPLPGREGTSGLREPQYRQM